MILVTNGLPICFKVIGKLPPRGEEAKVEWKVLDESFCRSVNSLNVKWKILKFDVPEPHINVEFGEKHKKIRLWCVKNTISLLFFLVFR